MKILALDASSIINLVNGECFREILSLQDTKYQVGPIVREVECLGIYRAAVEAYISEGLITVLDESLASAKLFEDMFLRHKLGDGETECIVYGITTGCGISCDDRKARRAAKSELGQDKVTGSIGLLQFGVGQSLYSADQAYSIYQKMRLSGGFLPSCSVDVFKTGSMKAMKI